MGKSKGKQKKQIILPPDLPPEISEDEIEVSDEDLQFVVKNRKFAGFVSRLDTESINKQVTRVEGVDEDTVEALFESRRRKSQQLKGNEKPVVQVDPVDALPVKTLSGELCYRTFPQGKKEGENDEDENEVGDAGAGKGMFKMNKAERREKLKKAKKEAKKQGKGLSKTEETEQTPQEAVLAEVKEDLTVEEAFESKKHKLAEIGMGLLADPDANIKSLKEMVQLCKDGDPSIVKLAVLSLLAVFKDIIPGYRIRLPTEKELEMKVSKEVKKMRFYESTLLSAYKAYLLRLLALEKQSVFHHVAVRCISSLLDAVPHFNFWQSLLRAVVNNIGSSDDVIRKLCCSTIKSLFMNEGKHGGEATVEAVKLIAAHVKANNCELHPDSVEVFMSLSFDEDLRKSSEEEDSKGKNKKNNKRKNTEEPGQVPAANERKKSKKEMMKKVQQEVDADYKAVALTTDVMEQRRMQSETLASVFETYFRILKHTMLLTTASPEENASAAPEASKAHPLLAPCLNGLGKFSHLIDLDYIGDLMKHLKILASGGSIDNASSTPKLLTVSERLRCCIVTFKVMRKNLDALNIDLQDFFVQLYNLILEYRPGRDQGEVLAEAFKIMLCDDRHHDMQKAAAFVKRLATFSLTFGSAESMAALVTVRHLLLKNVKCRNLLENDAGGGSVSGSIAKYQPYATDPNLSGALASVLWEVNLLSKHYHSAVSAVASSISTMNTGQNQVLFSATSPQHAFTKYSVEQETFNPASDMRKANNKRKRGNETSALSSIEPASIDETQVSKKLREHFVLLRDIKENGRLRAELNRANLSLQLYEEYKKQKKSEKPKAKKTKKMVK